MTIVVDGIMIIQQIMPLIYDYYNLEFLSSRIWLITRFDEIIKLIQASVMILPTTNEHY